jgi:predicted metallopeptidase
MREIRYELAPDIEKVAKSIAEKISFNHIDFERLLFFGSHGSKSKHTAARIHSLSRVWRFAFEMEVQYAIEVISHNFDKMDSSEKEKVIIHELLHIPRGFSGGFVNHKKRITPKKINFLYEKYKEKSSQK